MHWKVVVRSKLLTYGQSKQADVLLQLVNRWTIRMILYSRTQVKHVFDNLYLLASFCQDPIANGLANKLAFTYSYVGVVWSRVVAYSTLLFELPQEPLYGSWAVSTEKLKIFRKFDYFNRYSSNIHLFITYISIILKLKFTTEFSEILLLNFLKSVPRQLKLFKHCIFLKTHWKIIITFLRFFRILPMKKREEGTQNMPTTTHIEWFVKLKSIK